MSVRRDGQESPAERRLRRLALWPPGMPLALLAAGCSLWARPTPTPQPEPSAISASPTLSPAPTGTPFPTPTPTPTITPTATPDPYAGLTVADLAARGYGGGELTVVEKVDVAYGFSRYFVTYPSDGFEVGGFVDVPHGEGPFPVVLVLHGYVNPAVYQTLTYTARYADELARAGYLVLHPNYRNHPSSDQDPLPFRVGYAVDVLNLIALVREGAGAPGPLERADPGAIGLFGHSMGGGIALRVITVDPGVQAAVLYGAMSGDERRNYEKILEWSEGQVGEYELSASEEDLRRISPIEHLERVQAAVSLHHGAVDAVVPPAWSDDLCQRLGALGKSVECFSYPGQPHTFQGDGDRLFVARVLAFFDQRLKAR